MIFHPVAGLLVEARKTRRRFYIYLGRYAICPNINLCQYRTLFIIFDGVDRIGGKRMRLHEWLYGFRS